MSREAPRISRGGSREPIRGAIFDLDGTLVDSEPIYAESDRDFLARYGIAFEPGEYVGVGTRDSFLALERLHPDNPFSSLPLAERIRLKDEHFLRAAEGRLRAFPAMAAIAAGLSRRALPLAVASGSSPAVVAAALSETGLAGLFRVVLSSAELPRGKPAPDVFLEAARRLGLPPASLLVFEDSRPGLAAARAAGMRCVVLPPPGAAKSDFALSGADIVVEGGPDAAEPEALMAALERIGLPHRGA